MVVVSGWIEASYGVRVGESSVTIEVLCVGPVGVSSE